MPEYYNCMNDELTHHGVKGMKWGVRKKRPESSIKSNVRMTKQRYKDAKKAYNKSYNKAYNRAAAAYSPFKKHRLANDARWEDATNKANKLNTAQLEYRSAKRARKEAILSTHKKLEKRASLGERLTYNRATRRKAAKYMVDNNMPMSEATKKAKNEAWRNSAIAMVGAAGAITISQLMSKR